MAREFGVGWECAKNCVRRHGEPLVDDPARLDGIAALGIHGHKMLSANGEHRTLYVTCIVDVAHGRFLDVVRDRNADDVAFWLSQASGSWRQGIEAVAIDPHRGATTGSSWPTRWWTTFAVESNQRAPVTAGGSTTLSSVPGG